MPGDVSVLRSPSVPLLEPAKIDGRLRRLPFGLVSPPVCEVTGGSMSNVDKKDVSARSSFLLVMLKKESSNAFCSTRGVPFRSST